MSLPEQQAMRALYLEQLRTRHATVTLPIASTGYTFPLQTLFQPMVLRYDPFTAQQDQSDASTIIEAEDGTEALTKSASQRIVILGGPGMGKTTAMKALLHQAITIAQADRSAPLPLFISLPDLARSALSLPEYIRHTIGELRVDTNFADILIEAINTGQAFLCLDSLDEILPALRPDIIALINREALRCQGTWIVGSRFTEYQGGQFSHSQFAEWELQPLDEKKRLNLALQLLPALHNILHHDLPASEKPPAPSAETFTWELQHASQIASWAKNPLLFSLAAVSYVQSGHLPATRAMLYQQVTETIFKMRIPSAARRTELHHLLASLALQFYQTHGRNFTVQDILASLPSLVAEQSPESLYTTVADILNTGVLESVAHQTYGFKHQMFQEYLSAVALADQLCAGDEAQRQNTWNFIWQKRRFSRWNEILRLLVGVLVQDHGSEGLHIVSDWLRALLAEKDTPDSDPGDLCLILAVNSLCEFGERRLEPEMLTLAQQVLEQWARRSIELDRIGGWRNAERLQDLKEIISLFPLQIVLPIIKRLQQHNPNFHNAYHPSKAPGIIDFAIPVSILSHIFRDMLSITLYDCHRIRTLQTEAVIVRLTELLSVSHQNPNNEDQKTVLQILGNLGEKAPISPLIDIWQDTTRTKDQRIAAARALSMDNVPTPFEIFLQMLQTSIPEFRAAAVKAISARNGQASLDLLLHALQDSSHQVLRVVLEGLYDRKILVSDVLLRPLIFSKSGDISRVAWNWLYERQAGLPLEEWLAALQHEYSHVRESALRYIAAYDPTTLVEPLLPILSLHKKGQYRNDIRVECIQALGILDERVPLQPLQELLHDEDERVRAHVLRVLLQRNALPSSDILLPMLHHSSTSEVAAEALALLGAEAPIPALLELVRSPSTQAAYGAALSLRYLYKHVPTEAVLPLLQHEHIINSHRSTHLELIRLLQLQGAELPLEILVHTLDSDSSEKNPSVIATLCLAGPHAPIELLLHKIYGRKGYRPRWIDQLFYVLYEWVTPDHLRHALNHTSDDQLLAIRLLDDDESTSYLLEIAQDTTRSRNLRDDAMYILCGRDIPVPLEYLLQATRRCYEGMGSYVEKAVERLGAEAPIEQLLPLLGEDNNRLQPAVLHALKRIAQYLPAETIFSLFEDHNPMVRNAAIEIAGAMKERAPLDYFLSIAHDKTQDSDIRETVIGALGEMGTRVSVNILLDMLQDDNVDIRSAVLYDALKDRGESIPLEPLLTLLNDPDEHIVRLTLSVLAEQAKIGVTIPIEPIIPLLDHEDKYVVQEAASVLCIFGANAPIDALLAHLFDKDTREFNDDLFYELRNLGSHAPLEAILNALPTTIDMDSWYVSTTLEELAEVMPERILKHLLDDPRSIMRLPVLRAIQTCQDPIYLPLVLESLQSTEKSIRHAAIQALADLHTWAPIEPLLDLLQTGDSSDRICILYALIPFGTRVPSSSLLTLLESHDSDIHKSACDVLKKLYPAELAKLAPIAKAVLRGEPAQGLFVTHMHYRIAETIAEMGRATPEVLNMVIELLDYPFWEVRVKAIETLGKLRRNIPDPVIRRLIALRNAPELPAIRYATNQALAGILSLEQGMEGD